MISNDLVSVDVAVCCAVATTAVAQTATTARATRLITRVITPSPLSETHPTESPVLRQQTACRHREGRDGLDSVEFHWNCKRLWLVCAFADRRRPDRAG